MNNVDDAIESFFSYLKRHRLGILAIPFDDSTGFDEENRKISAEVFERAQKASVFFLGSNVDLTESIKVVIDDLAKDLEYGFPMPFNEMVMLVKCSDDVPEQNRWWLATVLLRIPETRMPDFKGCKNLIFICVVSYHNHIGWQLNFTAIVNVLKMENRSFRWEVIAQDSSERASEDLGRSMILSAFKSMALISHPNNYILLETPTLTLKEDRRIKEGKHISGGKRPRYIIVDHEVLVGMRTPSNGHASPVPHKRRGHWMRLAERCIHAKSRGDDRAWVKHCDVGQLEFESEGRRYQVLTDFQDRIQREGY